MQKTKPKKLTQKQADQTDLIYQDISVFSEMIGKLVEKNSELSERLRISKMKEKALRNAQDEAVLRLCAITGEDPKVYDDPEDDYSEDDIED